MTAAELRADPTIIGWLLLPLPLDAVAVLAKIARERAVYRVGPPVEVDGVGTVLPIRAGVS